MLVSTTDTIPGMKIVKVLGEVHARNNPIGLSLDMAENAKKWLIKEAEKLGANAIVGFGTQRQQYQSGRGLSRKAGGFSRNVYYSHGTAVIVEEIKDSNEKGITTPQSSTTISQPKFCPQCGAKLQSDAKFCMQCGNKI